MGRKAVAEAKKRSIVGAVRSGQVTAADASRRWGFDAQTIRRWMREYPDAGSTPPSAPAAPTSEAPPGLPPALPPPSPGEGGLEAALAEALGKKSDPSLPPAAVPPQAPGVVVNPTVEDEQLVWMAGNTVLGFGTRGVFFLACRREKVRIRFSKELGDLCVLTEAEKAGLRPTIPFLAPMIREFIGSSKYVALGTALVVVGAAMFDRTLAVSNAVHTAAEKLREEEKLKKKPEVAA